MHAHSVLHVNIKTCIHDYACALHAFTPYTLPPSLQARSAARGLLLVTRMRSATAQSRSIGSSSWNHITQKLRLYLICLVLPEPLNL